MTHWKLTLAYDGTSFHGWQIQPGLATVQGLLSDALFRIAGERVLPQGSGRTDAGVHAFGQVVSFSLEAGIPSANLQRALNDVLPGSVRVFAAENAAADFHARHSALRKTYEYRIFPLRTMRRTGAVVSGRPVAGDICPPMLAPYVWACRWALDLDALKESAQHVVGVHDFTSFAASDLDATARAWQTDQDGKAAWHSDRAEERQVAGAKAQDEIEPVMPGLKSQPILSEEVPDISQGQRDKSLPATCIRTVSRSEWEAADGLLVYRVTANGFLHHMVRNLVGTFVECGAGRVSPEAIPGILGARDRGAAGPTAPAAGLFLVSVEYAPNESGGR